MSQQRFDAWFNGVSLLSVCPSAVILDIAYKKPQWQTTAEQKAIGNGVIRTGRIIQNSSVSIQVMVREYAQAQRQSMVQALAEWASGDGYLQTSDRINQRLYCSCDTPAVVGSALKWLETITIVFMAYEKPFWEETFPSALSLIYSSSAVSGNLFGTGFADDPYCEGSIVASGGALTSFSITAGNTSISASGLSVAKGGTIYFGTDERGIFGLKSGNTGLLSKVTPESSDYLRLQRGKNNAVTFSANTGATLTIMGRGLYY